MQNTIIYLIRHADQLKIKAKRNNFNELEQITNEKIILSVNGEKEAEKLSKSVELKNIDVLWSSNYVRALSTAKYIAFENNISINIDANFNERKLGDLETLAKLGENKRHSYTVEQLLDEELTNVDGESRKEVKNRFEKSLNSILEENLQKRIAIVSHGAAIKYILMKWCELNELNQIVYNDNILIEDKLEIPNVIKLTFNDKKLIYIEKIACI